MADQADVETALVSIIANSLYPNGSSSPSVIGLPCRVYRGFPAAPTLDTDLAAGAVHVSLTAAEAAVKNVTRYPKSWTSIMPSTAILNAAVEGTMVSFSGVCATGQLVGVTVDGALFPYAVQASDSPPTVASNVAALLRNAGLLVDYQGVMVDVPSAVLFNARVVVGAGALQEIKRQLQEFRVSIWCSDPASRDLAAPVVDEALALRPFVALSDGSSARLSYVGTAAQDSAANANLYRRDLTYSAEYPTTVTQFTPAMLFGTASFYADTNLIKNVDV